MDSRFTNRRSTLSVLGAVLVAILLLWLADPVVAAPRAGTTVARGLPAEVATQPVTGGQDYSIASLREPAGQRDAYFVIAPIAAWIVGVVGALLLLGGAQRFAVAQRRARSGRLADLTGRRRPAGGDRQDRRAA